MNEDAYIERTEAFPATPGCEPDDEESMEAVEQTAQQRFDKSVQREIRRLIAKGKAESMEPPPWTDPETQPKAFALLKKIILESMGSDNRSEERASAVRAEEWPIEPCESMEFRDGQPPGYCCENCDEIDSRLNEDA